MKLYKKILVGAACTLGLSACTDYLDVNKDPSSPTIEEAPYEQLIPWSQFYMNHIYFIAGQNASFYTGNYIRNADNNEGYASRWNLNGTCRNANAQQWFLTQVANNYEPMYTKSMAAGAYHYAGVAKFLRAYGYIMEVDLFGEIPYTEACGESASPKYDTGDVVYLACLDEIDEAIELFSRTQESGASPLAAADYWNGGDTQKWIKACYLMKARWMNHFSKKSAGSYKDIKYDEAAILACLEKAQQSNEDNTIVRHTDTNTNSHDILGWNEPVDYNPLFSCIGSNTNFYVTKTLADNLENFDGKGVEDPRLNKILPWTRSQKSADSPADLVWTPDGQWRRTEPVNMQTDIINLNGPYALSFGQVGDATKPTNWKLNWYCNDAARAGDTIYVPMRCGGTGYYARTTVFFDQVKNVERSTITGNCFVHAESPSYVATYQEACFIKAEVLMRKGDKSGAFEAYKKGVRAAIDMVNDQTKKWASAFPTIADNPSIKPMTEDEINAFINGALGSASDITMGKIMTQKLIAMPFNLENWNDMRRFDYDTNIFMNWNKPYYYTSGTGTVWTYCPVGKTPRRWKQASYEINYNYTNLEAIGAQVPGALELEGTGGTAWYAANEIMTLPIFWDRAE